jgi:hypothetical protein
LLYLYQTALAWAEKAMGSRMTELSKWVPASKVAAQFGVCRGTVYYWIKVKKYFTTRRMGSRIEVLHSEVRKYLVDGMPAKIAKPKTKKPSAKRTAAKDMAEAVALAAKGGGTEQAG